MKGISMRPGTLFLIGAIVLAGATAYFFYDYLQQVAKPNTSPKKQVVMAWAEIPARQAITAEMLRTMPMPPELALTNSISKIEDVVGKWSIAHIKQFEQIRRSDIAEKNKLPGLSPSIPDGKRAMTIGITDNKGVAGAIFPGDHVDIIANLKDPKLNQQVVQVPLQNLLVMAVDKSITDPTIGASGSLTLCVTPDEAQLITVAEESGAIRVMLRSRDDTQVIADSSVSISRFLKGMSVQEQPKVAPQSQPQTQTSPPPPPPGRKIKITIGKTEKEYEVNTSKENEVK